MKTTMKTDSNKDVIIEKRIQKYKVDPKVIDSINEMLLNPDIDGIVRVSLSEFDDYPQMVATLNFLRHHYTKHGWNIGEYGIENLVGSADNPTIVRETYLFLDIF